MWILRAGSSHVFLRLNFSVKKSAKKSATLPEHLREELFDEVWPLAWSNVVLWSLEPHLRVGGTSLELEMVCPKRIQLSKPTLETGESTGSHLNSARR